MSQLNQQQIEALAERWLQIAEELREKRDEPGWGVPGVVNPTPRTRWADLDKADAYDQCACELREAAQGKLP